MGDPFTLLLAGASAAVSVAGAESANEATERAAGAEMATQDIAAQQRTSIVARELQTLEGSVRASSAGRGVAGSRVETSILGSAFESALLQGSNIELNRFTQNAATQARADAAFQSPFLAGLSGLQSGFSLGNTLGGFNFGGTGAGALGTQGGFAGLNPQLPDVSGIGFA